MVKAFIQIKERRDELKEDLKSVQKIYDELRRESGPIVNEFVKQGIRSIDTTDGVKVYLATITYAAKRGDVDMLVVCEAMKKTEMKDLVKEGFNVKSLKSYVVEKLKAVEDTDEEPENPVDVLPDKIKKYFNVTCETELRITGKKKHPKKKEARNGKR